MGKSVQEMIQYFSRFVQPQDVPQEQLQRAKAIAREPGGLNKIESYLNARYGLSGEVAPSQRQIPNVKDTVGIAPRGYKRPNVKVPNIKDTVGVAPKGYQRSIPIARPIPPPNVPIDPNPYLNPYEGIAPNTYVPSWMRAQAQAPTIYNRGPIIPRNG